MGGYGSGRWGYGGKSGAKGLVEGCRSLDINRLVREGIVGPGFRYTGGWSWRAPDGTERASIGLDVRAGEDEGTLRLQYRVRRAGEDLWEPLDYPIPLTTTLLPSGGRRWWFTCMARRGDGSPCRQRAGKLYLPSGGHVFACRGCHDLTYQSCRESRKWDGMWRKLGAEVGMDPRLVKRVMEGTHRADHRRRRVKG